ncbi:WGR domain-containing protein [Cupriavidus basilensis]
MTIPSTVCWSRPRTRAAPLRSDQEDAGIAGADALLARPVSFHRLGDGVYLDRRNAPEARYIAQTVREMLRRETGLSLGIVAFSEAQQTAIEAALEALASEDADSAMRLEREYVREDDDQFNGLFVKNLENVQGDERDVIILSICYAPGPDGKMLMNFGPINQRGGEKRLNAIFGRARHRMAVVSTIQAEAITNVHNDGAAALRAFLQFAQASARGQFERAQAVLGALNLGARDAFTRQAASDSIRDAMAEALRARATRCTSMSAVPSSAATWPSPIRPRRAMRWRSCSMRRPKPWRTPPSATCSVPAFCAASAGGCSTSPARTGLHDAGAVLARIEAMLADGEDRALDAEVEPLAPVVAPPAQPLAPASDSGSANDASTGTCASGARQAELVRALRFEQGSSRKFWRASLSGTELSVSYGRIGSSGQVNLKQFDTAERARREMDKLVAEKLRKGYVEE